MCDEDQFSQAGNLIDNGNFRIGNLIRVGTYAHVYEAVEVASNNVYAVKCLFKAGLTKAQLAAQREEVELHMAVLPHPNIVDIIKVVETTDVLYIIMELCEDDLYECIIREGGFEDDSFVYWAMIQLIDTIQHCHSRNVYHNDLKPENVLVGERFSLKLADFGLATWENESSSFGFGTTIYMAPECFGQEQATSYRTDLADVWSLGIILMNMRFGRNPWQAATKDDPLFSQYLEDRNFLQSQFYLTPEFNKIIKRVLHPNPKKRCSLAELKSMLSSNIEISCVPEYSEDVMSELEESFHKGVRQSSDSQSTMDCVSRSHRWSTDSGLGKSYQEAPTFGLETMMQKKLQIQA